MAAGGGKGIGGLVEKALWQAYRGYARLDGLAPHCVIDRCAAATGEVTFRPASGGSRTYGLRPIEPEQSLREQQSGFFNALAKDIAENGVRLPILLWGIGGKLYTRYGASRVWASRKAGYDLIPAVLCDFTGRQVEEWAPGFVSDLYLGNDPVEILRQGFGNPTFVGSFEASHERLDMHRAGKGLVCE